MSHKSVSLAFFATYGDRHDVEGCTPLFDGRATIYTTAAGTPAPLDFAAYKQLGYMFLDAFADLSASVIEQVEEGDRVVNRVMWAGTQTGALGPIPATGRSFRSESIVIDTIENGQIVERREVNDMLGMMQQLGMVPALAAA